MLLTLKEMRNIILTQNGSVIWQGRSISRSNIHELPSEAEWAIAAGQNTAEIELDLEKERERIDQQLALLKANKSSEVEKPKKTKKDNEKLSEDEKPLPEVVLSSKVK
jgi:hypothetical protein